MADRPFAYVCSPFRGDVERNTERAREYCRQVYEAGYTPIAPHLYFTQFLNDDYPKERAAGMEMGVALLPLCQVLLVCGNDITEGMKAEIGHAHNMGIGVCSLEGIPPIPTLENYRDDLTNLENIDIAVRCIEGMSGGRFHTGIGGAFIYPDENAYLAVNMKRAFDYDAGVYSITFDANIRTMGQPITTDGVIELQREVSRVQTLLALLESRRFVLTPEELQAFNDSIRQRIEQTQNTVPVKDAPSPEGEKPSVLRKIAEAREQQAASPVNRKPGRPRKSHGEEL